MTAKRMRWDAILSRLPMGRIAGAEVGVWQGKCAVQLLAARPKLTLLMVDRWCPPTPSDSYAASGAAMAAYPLSKYQEALHIAHQKCDPYAPRAMFVVADSVEAAQKVADGSLDFVFVDGDHSYDGVLRDLLAWWPKVCATGWIGGHDFSHPLQGQVEEAVNEFFPTAEIELDANRTWFVRRAG